MENDGVIHMQHVSLPHSPWTHRTYRSHSASTSGFTCLGGYGWTVPQGYTIHWPRCEAFRDNFFEGSMERCSLWLRHPNGPSSNSVDQAGEYEILQWSSVALDCARGADLLWSGVALDCARGADLMWFNYIIDYSRCGARGWRTHGMYVPRLCKPGPASLPASFFFFFFFCLYN